MPRIIAYVERIPGREFRAQFPDFPGVRASHQTLKGVADHVGRALQAHIDGLLQANSGVPRPMRVDDVKADGRYRHGFLSQIEAEIPESRLYSRSRHHAEPSS